MLFCYAGEGQPGAAEHEQAAAAGGRGAGQEGLLI